jgi:Flp pilus assembly protein TadG
VKFVSKSESLRHVDIAKYFLTGDFIMTIKAREKGQALILIALVAIGLFGFAALAIDGSAAFSDERHAQNAADTSALAAALANIRGKDWNDTVSTARIRATSNGYDNNGTTNIVEVYLCNDANATCTALPAGAKPEEYIQVKITSHVKTYFARVIGRNEMKNVVTAVAHAVPGYRRSLFSGQAMVALDKHDCASYVYNGGGKVTVTGSGIFVNSDCPATNPAALNSNANGAGLEVPCYNVVGTVNDSKATVTTTGPCSSSKQDQTQQIANPLAAFPRPNVSCNPSDTPVGNTATVLNPGYYPGSNFPPINGDLTLNPGTYCINASNGFNVTGGTTVHGSGVLIYMISGGVNWNANTTLSANTDPNSPFEGLLLALAPLNSQSVNLQGNGTSTFTGTILAPESEVKLAGSQDSATVLYNQVIANKVSVTGGAGLVINYQANQQWQPPVPPAIEMNQ